MIKKEELIEILKGGKIGEENAVKIFTKHLSSAVFWAGLKEESREEVRDILDRLARESVGHGRLIDRLIKRIQEEDKDAF